MSDAGSGAAAGVAVRAPKGQPEARADSPYAYYALGVLVLVYIFNAMDRTILSILAEDIKRTFDLSDSTLGFLYGTAFGVFYALFGYPVGRLLDRGNRVKLLSLGLALWSVMTAFCGLSGSVTQLMLSRMGVAVGEASASPAGFSLISDWFTKAKRGMALGFYIGGMYIGSGAALAVGGLIVSRWHQMYPGQTPFGLEGWQVAFLTLGVPGLLLAAWVYTLREPPRGLSDNVIKPAEGRAWSRFLSDVSSVIPPFTFYRAYRASRGQFIANLMAAVIAGLGAWGAILLTGDLMQWTTIGVGYYASFSAAQALWHNDRPTFALTWGTPTFVLAMVGFGAVSAINVIMGFWSAPLALRHFDIEKSTVGLTMGGIQALFGVLGVITGGKLSDILLRFTPKGRIWVGIFSSTIPAFFIFGMCTTTSPTVYFLLFCPVAFIGNAWIAAGAATIQELVLPRMRGTATTTYFLFSTMIGSGLGPYVVGKISMIQGSLAVGIMCGLVASPLAVVTLWFCSKNLKKAETTKWDRAAAAGEVL